MNIYFLVFLWSHFDIAYTNQEYVIDCENDVTHVYIIGYVLFMGEK